MRPLREDERVLGAADNAPRVVLDTNVALDLLVFDDLRALPLGEALRAGRARWLVCPAMRDELVRVLGYPGPARRLAQQGRDAAAVLAAFDALARMVDPPPSEPPPCRCSDPDDQMFVDLALAHGAALLSKDAAVLALRRALAQRGVSVRTQWAESGCSA